MTMSLKLLKSSYDFSVKRFHVALYLIFIIFYSKIVQRRVEIMCRALISYSIHERFMSEISV